MSGRMIVAATCGVMLMLGGSGCLKKSVWMANELHAAPLDVSPTTRGLLDSKRSAALSSSDLAIMADYLRYLWQFDWEYRHFIARVEAGKSPKLPDDLVGFDREQVVQEAIAAWSKLRPAELPADPSRATILRADFYATAVGWGCRDSERAFAKLLVHLAEVHPLDSFEASASAEDYALLSAECGHDETAYTNACRAAADLVAGLSEPSEYQDLDLDKSPEASVRVKLLTSCSRGGDDWMTDEEQALVDNYNEIASTWLKVHYPEEWAALMEARRKAAEAAAEAAAQREQEWGSSDFGSSSSDSSFGGGGGSSAASGPTMVSVRLHNSCSTTVKLFYGNNPGFGSGRSTSIGSNTTTSEQMREGDMIWIVDDRGQGIASYSASPSRSSVEISSSCAGFR